MSRRDLIIRLAAFRQIEELQRRHGDVLPLAAIRAGFLFQGERILLSTQARGIFKPKCLELPLSVTTVPPSRRKARPYDDRLGEKGILLYRYRGTNPGESDNVKLREVMRRHLPLIYFYGIVPGKYVATCPVYVVGDEPERLTFHLQVDDPVQCEVIQEASVEETESSATAQRRRYCTIVARKRLQQASFRERVLEAYRTQCAVCRLRQESLLEAAHIVPFAQEGPDTVNNGLSLCRLHHGAFDTGLLGIRPDLRVQIAPRILEEEDGPMLRHGLQGVHDLQIEVPRSIELRPDEEGLALRYGEFLRGIGA